MTKRERKLEQLNSQYARGFLSSDAYEKEKRKLLNETDWEASFNIKKIGLTIVILLICGIGFYVFALVDWGGGGRRKPPNKIKINLNNTKQVNLDSLVSEMCNCYDNAVLRNPSQELGCARLKTKIYERIAFDSLKAQRFDSLINYCPNYPICTNLQQDLQKLKNDLITAYDRKVGARKWQWFRSDSQRDRDIKEADEDYEKLQTQIQNIERRITINCNND